MARIDDMLLMAYVDGEVDAATAREVETALAGDPSMAPRLAAFRGSAAAARAAFADAMHEDPPDRLIGALGGATTGGLIVPFQPHRARRLVGWAMAAGVAALVLGSGGLIYTGQITPPDGLQFASSDRWLDHVAAFYEVYAQTKIEEERLLVDFNADDIPELGKWFGARLGRSLAVPDLSARGFQIQGGRLLIISGKPAAQFLYYSESGDLVGLVIAIHEGGDQKARHDRRKGSNIVHWRKGGYAYALVGKIDPQTLQGLADDAWHALDTI
ncbi:MAG TPA: anti-sigma factor [Alphaproteobacteria bacterium]|nr:anti-sigma factor [Alphaproteobacteria bacterium]